MATLRTEITEIVTGLGMFGYRDLRHALSVEPEAFRHVPRETYGHLRAALAAGTHVSLFEQAWANGQTFARSEEALRGRAPWIIEWKGPHRPPGYDRIPADLRIDHVFLVSCKYGSDILLNSSPSNLFDRLLSDRRPEAEDWYASVAPAAYQALFEECRFMVDGELPDSAAELDKGDRRKLKRSLPRRLTDRAQARYMDLVDAVAAETARRWRQNLASPGSAETMVWRMLRMESAPYFVLGESASAAPVRYRVVSPGDLRRTHVFTDLEIEPDTGRGQPVVEWTARFNHLAGRRSVEVRGHVEIRWSHGKFAQPPEAKVYLDTPHHLVPAYVPLEPTDSRLF